MKRKALYWTPRVLSVAMVIFISLFAFDVFSGDYTFWESIVALLIHLIPSIVLVGIVILSWKKEQVGGLIFVTLGILNIIMTSGREMFLPGMIITLPIILTGILFIINGRKSSIKNGKQQKQTKRRI
jgi:hypothetical protein